MRRRCGTGVAVDAILDLQRLGYAGVPLDLRADFFNKMFDEFDSSATELRRSPTLVRRLTEVIDDWRCDGAALSANAWIGSSAARKRKTMVQGFDDFLRDAMGRLADTSMAALLDSMIVFDAAARLIFEQLVPGLSSLSTTVRILRYEPGCNPGVSIHVDQDLLSLVVLDRHDDRFRIGPFSGISTLDATRLQRPVTASNVRRDPSAIVFPGTRVRMINSLLKPSPHLVTPAEDTPARHSATVFLHAPIRPLTA